MKLRKHLFGKPYFASLVCKGYKTFHEKMLPFCLIVIGCFCHVMNDHPPLVRWCLNDTVMNFIPVQHMFYIPRLHRSSHSNQPNQSACLIQYRKELISPLCDTSAVRDQISFWNEHFDPT